MSCARVKICGITRETDLRAAVAAGADALGFVFSPRSKRCLDPGLAESLVAQVPPFVARVALFMDQEVADVERVLERVPVNVLQFHGREEAGFCRQFGLPYIKAVSMREGEQAAEAGNRWPDAAGLLLDSHSTGDPGGTGETFDWTSIPTFSRPLILAGGLTAENVREAVVRVKPWAVDVSSGVEDAPGVKNAEKMRKFVREAKREY